uniref:Uncharacterized protein n=1 Tax=Rhabditophanes sp. KR3021 TaxID=114890 RepID=A0AC35U0W7_9BILA
MAINNVDMSVKIKIAQMRFIFLNLWVEPFQAETQAAAATERATQAGENIRQLMEVSPPKIELDIELAAPTIIVPKTSTSCKSLFIELGKLTITNTFQLLQKSLRQLLII